MDRHSAPSCHAVVTAIETLGQQIEFYQSGDGAHMRFRHQRWTMTGKDPPDRHPGGQTVG